MNAADNKWEILIGKFLDGELSPPEQRLLENELQRDGHVRDLLEQMRVLHECSCGVVTHEVLGRGADPEELFERAWQQNKRSFWRHVVRADGHLRFAAGVAAGFLLGLVLHFVSIQPAKIPNVPSPPRVASDSPSATDERTGLSPTLVSRSPQEITREVDWYVFTDRTGNQWLVEGVREGMVRPAAYRGSL